MVCKMEKRLIVYGDIHGCLDEFKLLRKKIKPTKNDIEVIVGDFLNKGLYSTEVIKYIQKNHIFSVMGNNEARLLKYRKKGKQEYSRNFDKIMKKLTEKDFEFLEKLPYFLKFKNITIVHGGIPVGLKLDHKLTKEQKREITLLRYYDKDMNSLSWKEKDKIYKYWSELYDGSDGFVVYGHQPFKKPREDRFAVGIDTGCVYGGSLTAVIFKLKKDGYDTKNYTFVSVKAKKKYFT